MKKRLPQPLPTPHRLLPREAQCILRAAAATPFDPKHPAARAEAIDRAILTVKLMYPHLFKAFK